MAEGLASVSGFALAACMLLPATGPAGWTEQDGAAGIAVGGVARTGRVVPMFICRLTDSQRRWNAWWAR